MGEEAEAVTRPSVDYAAELPAARAAYRERLAGGLKEPPARWDPERMEAEGLLALALKTYREWGQPWRAPQARISRKHLRHHAARKAARKGTR